MLKKNPQRKGGPVKNEKVFQVRPFGHVNPDLAELIVKADFRRGRFVVPKNLSQAAQREAQTQLERIYNDFEQGPDRDKMIGELFERLEKKYGSKDQSD